MTKRDRTLLLTCVGVCVVIALLDSLAVRSAAADWYVHLRKPRFDLPAAAFLPVWVVLNGLAGVAVFLVWRRGIGRRGVNVSLAAFAGALLLHAAWAPVLFGLRSIEGGLLIALALMFAIGLAILLFTRVAWTPALLLVPLAAWAIFAVYLNAQILSLNGFGVRRPVTEPSSVQPRGAGDRT